ncbi:hypothetical protein CK203_028411 [Vitis vinifera]|uniref:Retrotransposon gag domain-containing protein n=1 Tax=Vitis vinifera TaxID=29760 RepID=A0A438J096_VITVI|nr:hypothetical protein CK203_028411 [Vitis vinifera]
MPRAPREESSDSTHFSAKRQRDRKSQLSNSMCARLGPKSLRSRPPVATTWAPRPDPMVTPMVQNVHPHRDPMVTPMMRNVHSHLAAQQAGRNLPNEPPIGSISKRLDDMLSTPFALIIITSPKGIPLFPASLQGQALSWFHRLPPNSVGNFRDLSEAFVGQYLCSARHKQNISTLQNIKMQDNESLREFVKRIWSSRTSGRGLQHGCCPTDLQAKHLSRHSIFRITSKKPPTTMDDLFRRANKYSMLEDDVRAATQQVWLLEASRVTRKEMLNLPDGQAV